MTIAYNKDTDLERELTARLSELAHAFIADLNAQGRLVETGGADTLRRLRQQHPTPPPAPDADPGEPGGEVTEIEAHPVPGAPAQWEAVTAPCSGEDTPGPPATPRPLRILGASEPCPVGLTMPDFCDAPAPALEPALVHQPTAPAPGPVTGQGTGVQEPRTTDESQTQPPAPARQAAVPAPASARPTAASAPASARPTAAPALAATRRPVALGPVTGQNTGQNTGAQGPRTADGSQAQPPPPTQQVEGLEPHSAQQAAELAPVPVHQTVGLEPALAQQPAAPAPEPAQHTGVQESRTPGEDGARPSAAVTAARLRAENAARLEVTGITADHDRVDVRIHAVSLSDWEYWLAAIGAPLNAPTHRSGWVQTATADLDGVEVRLTAEAVPRLLQEAAQRAADPFVLGGRVYDLALNHTDRLGQMWLYDGLRQEDDTPLLTLDGTSGPPYPLTSIVEANGPLTPVAANPGRHETG
ncbi:BN159_2729 family protein [Streptomyces sp. NPDC015414]|uniref:BN159_2729 family protein n=1 Tax=Streptomyces sp. NPDC015414 TaxID=3364957 RepID=UPI0037027B1D